MDSKTNTVIWQRPSCSRMEAALIVMNADQNRNCCLLTSFIRNICAIRTGLGAKQNNQEDPQMQQGWLTTLWCKWRSMHYKFKFPRKPWSPESQITYSCICPPAYQPYKQVHRLWLENHHQLPWFGKQNKGRVITAVKFIRFADHFNKPIFEGAS